MSTDFDDLIPSASACREAIALAESEKASQLQRARAHEEAERQALLDRLQQPSGVADPERLVRAAALVKRAIENGLTEIQVIRFPKELCTDRGRAINNLDPDWPVTLTGLPKELYAFWHEHMRPRGYKLKAQVVEFPGGIPGDIGITLSWS